MNVIDGRTYGMEECPYENHEIVRRANAEYGDDCGLCFDFDHFGGIVCGLCGANKEWARESQQNFLQGVMKNKRIVRFRRLRQIEKARRMCS
jgi:hypothetical protein